MTYWNIPEELRQLVQWIVWRYEMPFGGEKPTKVPYNPKNGLHASTSDRNTWASFEEAVTSQKNSNGRYDGIGFVFTKNDPYCGIDLDDPQGDIETYERQLKIFNFINSYAELSPSGKGLHIICKASVPHGRKRSFVEIYSEGRYFTMTGNVFRDVAIQECNEAVKAIWDQMGATAELQYFAGETIQRHEDVEVYEMASKAKNGDLFERLYAGDWSGYTSNADGSGSSEADFALIDIIAYYTKNKAQIQRMFEASALGKRPKYAKASPARRAALIGYMINKSFDRELPPIDLSKIIDSVNAAKAASPSPADAPAVETHAPALPVSPFAEGLTGNPSRTHEGFPLDTWLTPPQGILGAVSKFFYDASPRPIYEIAVAGALGFMAGMCGRSYNVERTGLNLYIMLLAATGTGKEAMATGTDRLLAAVAKDKLHSAIQSVRGPSDIMSGQALLKHLSKASPPCFVSIVGEFGLKLQQISHPNASGADISLRKVMLDIFTKSGAGAQVHPTIYSDKANNTDVINSPAFSLLGESVPSEFYRAFDESAVTGGLLPRFLIVEYGGEVPPFNRNAWYATPHYDLISKLDTWYASISSRMVKGEVIDVRYAPEAEAFLNRLEELARNKINSTSNDVYRQLWNRAHLKTLKVASILAVSDNTEYPTISLANAEWAASLVITDIVRTLKKFEMGAVGKNSEERDQQEHVRRIFAKFIRTDYHMFNATHKKLVTPEMKFNNVVPYSYIAQWCSSYAAFKNSRIGTKASLVATLRDMENQGIISEVKDKATKDKFGIDRAICYVPVDVTTILADDT